MYAEVELSSGMKWWSRGILAVRPHMNMIDLEFVKPYNLSVVFPLAEIASVTLTEFSR